VTAREKSGCLEPNEKKEKKKKKKKKKKKEKKKKKKKKKKKNLPPRRKEKNKKDGRRENRVETVDQGEWKGGVGGAVSSGTEDSTGRKGVVRVGERERGVQKQYF